MNDADDSFKGFSLNKSKLSECLSIGTDGKVYYNSTAITTHSNRVEVVGLMMQYSSLVYIFKVNDRN